MGENAPYPIFLECREYTLDDYWREIFTCCAHGRFPKGIKMLEDNTMSVYETGGNRKLYTLDMSDATVLFRTMMTVFRDSLGMRSSSETELDELEITKGLDGEHTEIEEWKQIKNKRLREHLVREYVLRMKEKHNLTHIEMIRLLSTIELGVLLKDILPEDFELKNNRIDHIRTVKIDGNEFELEHSNLNRGGDRSYSQSRTTTPGHWISKYVADCMARNAYAKSS